MLDLERTVELPSRCFAGSPTKSDQTFVSTEEEKYQDVGSFPWQVPFFIQVQKES